MMNAVTMQLRDVLVALYPTEADVRRVAHDAGIAVERVALGGSALNNWAGVVAEAVKNGQVADLLDVATHEYRGNQELMAAQAAFVAALAVVAQPLPDKGLYLLNFGRELTAAQQAQIEERVGEQMHKVITVPVKFADARPFGPQCITLLDQLEWSRQQWETRPLLLIPPGYAPAALTLISLVHGRRGHFPALVRLQPETTGMQTNFVLAEIVNLQALRNAAREMD